jgi:transketolase
VIVPCDSLQARLATLASARISGPVYIRLGREPIPVITTDRTPFKFGQAQIMKPGKDATIVACGLMVYLSLLAAQRLSKEGVSCEVINLHTIKPIDRKALITSAQRTGTVITAEEHQLAGGMGGAVAEVLAQECPVPMEMVGVRDTFGESGQPWELMKKYNLMDADIIKAVKRALKRKP